MKIELKGFTPNRPLSTEQRKIIDTMKAEIRRSEIRAVSFKMMNTLVITPFLTNNEIFHFMQEDFSGLYVGNKTFFALRTEAEKNVIRKAEKRKKPAKKPYLDCIYDELMKISKISPSSREKLMKRECELTEFFCFARQSGMELYNEALKCGKKIYITATTAFCPLPKERIEHILRDCGYDKYDGLIYPPECDVKTGVEGNLYEYIAEKSGITPFELIHIGSNVVLDVEEAVKKGVKALLLTPPKDLMLKSGRLRPYILSKHKFDYDEPKLLALRCALGIYAAYGFDYPQNKAAQSDFCTDEYMQGFITLGTLSLYKDLIISDETEIAILSAFEQNKKMTGGREDFVNLFRIHFGSVFERFGFEGCNEPYRFLYDHGTISDRMSAEKFISADIMEKWSSTVTEPDITPVYTNRGGSGKLARLADKMFPPGTQVRNYVDGILMKMYNKK